MVGIAPNIADIEAYWKLDDTSDATGNGYTLIINGATNVTGIIDNGLSCDGVNDYFAINNEDVLSDSKWGISLWYKPTVSPPLAEERFVGNYAGGGNLNFRHLTSGKINMYCYDGAVKSYVTPELTEGCWHHLAMFFSTPDNEIYFFFNGVLVSTQAWGTVNWTSATGLTFGANRNLDYHGNGVFDEIMIFNNFTTEDLEDNMAFIYNGGSPTVAQQFPFSGGAVSKINGLSLDGVNKINGVAKTSITNINGVDL